MDRDGIPLCRQAVIGWACADCGPRQATEINPNDPGSPFHCGRCGVSWTAEFGYAEEAKPSAISRRKRPPLSFPSRGGSVQHVQIRSGSRPKPRRVANPKLTRGNAMADDVDFGGKWINTRGSSMQLNQDGAGRISGTYTTRVGSDGSGTLTREVVGQAHGDQIVFFVDWWPYSMTTWAGQVLSNFDGDEKLETVWTNTKNVSEPDEPNQGWAGVRSGGDVFTKAT